MTIQLTPCQLIKDENSIPSINAHAWNLKNGTDDLVAGQGIGTQTQRIDLWKGGGANRE